MVTEPGWEGCRTFLLDRREAESETVTSFYLVPEDGGTLPTYRPGQSLGFVLDLPDRMAPVIRNYTISDSPKDAFHYRLSIKREPAPADQPDLPPGVVSIIFMTKSKWGRSFWSARPAANSRSAPRARGRCCCCPVGSGARP